MPGFGDSAFIVILALLLFGPKKLPVLARQLGKLMADFRRASNEFRAQMEEELRIAEQADRQKEVASLEAATANKIEPPAPADQAPHTPPAAPDFSTPAEGQITPVEAAEFTPTDETRYPETVSVVDSHTIAEPATADEPAGTTEPAPPAAPIAVSGDLSLMPPATGLPVARSPRSAAEGSEDRVGPAPTTSDVVPTHETELETETLHG